MPAAFGGVFAFLKADTRAAVEELIPGLVKNLKVQPGSGGRIASSSTVCASLVCLLLIVADYIPLHHSIHKTDRKHDAGKIWEHRGRRLLFGWILFPGRCRRLATHFPHDPRAQGPPWR